MLDVHPPHETAHTWRDFFIHIATIVVGLLIAIGLEQAVEHFHHRLQVAETREELLQERVENRQRNRENVQYFRRVQATLQNNLQVLEAFRDHPRMTAASLPGIVYCESDWVLPTEGAWKAAQQSNVVSYMPQDEVNQEEQLYLLLSGSADQAGVTVVALNRACKYLRLDPDPTHLSPAQVQETLMQMIGVETEENSWADWLRDLHAQYPDFEAIPTQEEMSIATPLDAQKKAAMEKATRLTEKRVDAASPDPEQ